MIRGKGIVDVFGENVFTDDVMRESLAKNVYKAYRQTIENHKNLELATADAIANAMKDWAIKKGATHFCHWFQPLTGSTAEKHDSFIAPTSQGKVVMEFSGKELTQGEPDASSFPSGGLRATFEARGYTAWDCTSPVFIKEDGTNITLFIPSAFCSYHGDVLDKKTPLLRSMDALNKQGLRVLKALGNKTTKKVFSTCGAEQEYFLIDRKFYEKRLDLITTGRTLFGAPSPRGQEMDDHYFGSLDERVATFMNELNIELWKLGISAKSQHNEVSPGQYEIVSIYESANIATDHNQLVMEILRKVALRHELVCLINEKPFQGVNGSGKHVNWSISTNDGANLLNPGKTPHDNMIFLAFLCAIIASIDKNAKIMRASAASPGNEHRLGANEAPPAILSIFLGDQLNDVFQQLAEGSAKTSQQGGELKLGVSTLPTFPKDTTDRNRTSPFAFTGNKFEFRMVGSSQSVSGPNFVLNTIVADTLQDMADKLESSDDKTKTLETILHNIAKNHSKVVFNGDNYSQEWVKEAEKRGLPNISSVVESFDTITDDENIKLFTKHNVLSESELKARREILLEAYNMTINIEAKTMVHIAKRQIIPAAVKYSEVLAKSYNLIKNGSISAQGHEKLLKKLCGLIDDTLEGVETLQGTIAETGSIEDSLDKAKMFSNKVISAMNKLRDSSDKLEMEVDEKIWPLPSYAQMLFIK